MNFSGTYTLKLPFISGTEIHRVLLYDKHMPGASYLLSPTTGSYESLQFLKDFHPLGISRFTQVFFTILEMIPFFKKLKIKKIISLR